jgi:hypothetical protein
MRQILIYTILFITTVQIQFGQVSIPRANPFEVSTRVNDMIVKDSMGNSISTVAKSGSGKETIDSLKEGIISSGNPFDVNHVPSKRKSNVINPLTEIKAIKPKVSDKFMFWIMLFSLPLLALVISAKTSLMSYLVRSVVNLNMMKLTKREESNNYFLLLLLYLVFLINGTMFVYLLQKNYTNQEGISIWSWCLFGLLAVYVIRHVSMWLLSKIFPVEIEVGFYNYVIIVFNILFGILIIPVNIILAYMPEYTKVGIITGISLFLIFYVLRCIRGISASLFLIGQGILSFFVYLCTFEIAPLLIIIRAVLNFNGNF